MNILLKPLTIKNLVFKNRLIYPPVCIGKAKKDGRVSDALLSHYEEISRGGYFSTIFIPDSFVLENGRTSLSQLSAASDDMIEGLSLLATTIKNNGAKALLQLNHAGSCTFEKFTGSIPVSPSEISNPRGGDSPRALETHEIRSLIHAFRDSALRGRMAGFDGVEIHSAHGYLLNQFYSPLTNKRDDEYGGTIANRIRIHIEIVRALRETLGDDFIISLRLGALDYMEGGSTLEDSIYAAKTLEDEGIDLLSVSGGLCGYTNPFNNSPGYFSRESKAIKATVNIPIILTGGIENPGDIEALLENEACDMVGVGRAIIKDPTWARRAITSK